MQLSQRQQSLCLGIVGTVMVLLLLHALVLGVGASPFSLRALDRFFADDTRLISPSGLQAEFVSLSGRGGGLTLVRSRSGKGLSWFSGMKPVAWAPKGDRVLLTEVGATEEPRYEVVELSPTGSASAERVLCSGRGWVLGFAEEGGAIKVASGNYSHTLVPVEEAPLTVASLPQE
jgi:hypothetical protein